MSLALFESRIEFIMADGNQMESFSLVFNFPMNKSTGFLFLLKEEQ